MALVSHIQRDSLPYHEVNKQHLKTKNDPHHRERPTRVVLCDGVVAFAASAIERSTDDVGHPFTHLMWQRCTPVVQPPPSFLDDTLAESAVFT